MATIDQSHCISDSCYENIAANSSSAVLLVASRKFFCVFFSARSYFVQWYWFKSALSFSIILYIRRRCNNTGAALTSWRPASHVISMLSVFCHVIDAILQDHSTVTSFRRSFAFANANWAFCPPSLKIKSNQKMKHSGQTMCTVAGMLRVAGARCHQSCCLRAMTHRLVCVHFAVVAA